MENKDRTQFYLFVLRVYITTILQQNKRTKDRNNNQFTLSNYQLQSCLSLTLIIQDNRSSCLISSSSNSSSFIRNNSSSSIREVKNKIILNRR